MFTKLELGRILKFKICAYFSNFFCSNHILHLHINVIEIVGIC